MAVCSIRLALLLICIVASTSSYPSDEVDQMIEQLMLDDYSIKSGIDCIMRRTRCGAIGGFQFLMVQDLVKNDCRNQCANYKTATEKLLKKLQKEYPEDLERILNMQLV
ncbi:hypothetical protein QAD02_010349 [Eretmocerus hayati]|uniref:Uncharacterized protein n=1 Tax=Eretmocerus hayati TaxID=131215 RepID=A0ACC2NCN8_9HYME|nr:hypothetical protein QAD02_010349 [Eretmocerus hayati]